MCSIDLSRYKSEYWKKLTCGIDLSQFQKKKLTCGIDPSASGNQAPGKELVQH